MNFPILPAVAFVVSLLLPSDGSGETTDLGVAFAKFSPIHSQSVETGSRDGAERVAVPFAAAMPVLQERDQIIQVELPDNRAMWLRKSDVLRSESADFIVSGDGFRAESRPTLRLWRSLATVTEFLARGEVDVVGADYDEARATRTRFNLKLPVIARDDVDVLGDRSVAVAGILLPVRAQTIAALDRARGTSQTEFDVRFLVDVSGDARDFSVKMLGNIGRDLEGELRDDPNIHRFYLSSFANEDGRVMYSEVALSELNQKLTLPVAPATSGEEPLLQSLHLVHRLVRPLSGGTIIVIMSGAEIEPSASVVGVSAPVTLTEPKLTVLPSTSFILAQITPEPGKALMVLSESLGRTEDVVFEPFDDRLSRRVVSAILERLSPPASRPLESGDIVEICQPAAAAEELCVLPSGLTTAGKLPPPPRGAEDAEWYTTTVWVVVDGLILADL